MKDCFLMGLALGVICGAVIVNSNKEVQNVVENGKKVLKAKLKSIKNMQ